MNPPLILVDPVHPIRTELLFEKGWMIDTPRTKEELARAEAILRD